MKKITWILMLIVSMHFLADGQNIEQNFQYPPNSAKPQTWWHWMSGYVNKEGITKDLEMMANVGIGGVQIFEVRHHKLPEGPVEYYSEEWLEVIKHTISETNRLGLELTMHNCPGWSSTGGPWITPEKAQKMLSFTENFVESSGQMQKLSIERPNESAEFYKDIRILAIRATTELFKLKDWQLKGLHFRREHLRIYRIPRDIRNIPDDNVVQPNKIFDLTSQMSADGTIDVKLPKGKWVILRMGYSNNPKKNGPATKGATGLEIDKFDRSVLDLHWNTLIKRIQNETNKITGEGLNALLIDSYEAGYQNWTGGFEEQFKARCGYDIKPWMPCLAGYVVESLDKSERFLWDFRKVCADLMAENYYGYFVKKCHENGLKLLVEPYGVGVFDGFEVAKIADIPMGEFWYRRPGAWHEWSVKLASSAAHITGKQIVGAESYTSSGVDAAFHSNPYVLKPKGDHYFTEGLNRMIFHASAHQPWNESVKPGMTMAPHGIQLHRNNTWVPKGKGYFDYLSRCQYMLQQGQFCADFLYVFPEDYPNTSARRNDISPLIPAGYDFDVTNLKTLKILSVKDGRIVTPSGMSYRHVIIPYNRLQSSDDEWQRSGGIDIPYPQSQMRFTPETMYEIERLVKAGASVLAPRPVSSPSLVDYPKCDAVIKTITDELWGTGKIAQPESISEICKQLAPDYESSETNDVKYIHRKIDGTDFYFVANRQLAERKITSTFRISGKKPEFWDPVTGETSPAPNWRMTADGRTEISMEMSSAGSVFVVFREETKEKTHADNSSEPKPFATISGNWEVTFDSYYGPKKPVVFNYLDEWNNNKSDLIKYYSGTATYRKTFEVEDLSKPIYLDLGDVQFMAQVKINGKDIGLLWKPPYATEITGALKKGKNELEIEVTNSWVNRLIGDEKLEPLDLSKVPSWLSEGKPIPESSKRKTFITNKYYKANDKLVPSGLMGPVQLKR